MFWRVLYKVCQSFCHCIGNSCCCQVSCSWRTLSILGSSRYLYLALLIFISDWTNLPVPRAGNETDWILLSSHILRTLYMELLMPFSLVCPTIWMMCLIFERFPALVRITPSAGWGTLTRREWMSNYSVIAGESSSAPGGSLSCRIYLTPQLNTHEPR